MSKILLVTLVVSVLAICCRATPTTFCTPNPDAPVKKIPTLPQKTFQLGYEANIEDKGYTVSGFEVYDGPNERGKLSLTKSGVNIQLVYNYPTNEILTVIGPVCYAAPLNTSDGRFFFGYSVNGTGSAQMMSIAKVLHFDNDTKEEYKGYTTTRGMLTEQWDSCISWPEMNSQMFVSYFFTAQNWSTVSGDVMVPVRAIVRGQMDNGTFQYNFTHHYELSGFSPNINDTEDQFLPPRGVFCVNRKNTKPVPQLPDHFSFNSEVVQDQLQVVTNVRERYDFRAKLARVDYDGLLTTEFARNPMKEVHDFGTGLRYVMDRVYGNCTIKPIMGTEIDALPLTPGVVGMKNVTQLFHLDDTYVYVGRQRTRDTLSETWQSLRADFADGKTLGIYDWSFMAPEVQQATGATYDGGVPVRLALSVPDAGLSIHYNIYNFNNETPAIDEFDVGPCFGATQKRRFRLTFNGSMDTVLGLGEEIFKYEAFALLSALMYISPLRLTEMRTLADAAKFYLYFTVTDKPPIQGSVPNPDKEIPLNVSVLLLFKEAQMGNLNFTTVTIVNGDIAVKVIQPIDIREIDASGTFLPINIGQNGTLPTVPKALQFKMETIIPELTLITNSLEWYDYGMNMFRHDYGDPILGHQISEIHDFGTGVRYVLNSYFGNCTPTPIGSYDVDSRPEGQYATIRDPAQFFDMTIPYTYLGAGLLRGVDVDIWQAQRNDWPPNINPPIKSTWTWYWTTGTWLSIGGEAYEYQVPMGLTIESPGLTSINYIYDFRQQGFDIISISIESCFAANMKKHFQFSLPSNIGDKIEQNPNSFYYLATLSLASYLDISPVRISSLEYIRNNTDVFVLFTMLDKAPIKGSVQMNKTELSLDDASKLFLAEVDAGKLMIAVFPNDDDPKGQPVLVAAFNASELAVRETTCRYKPPPPPAPIINEGFSTAMLAGVSVGTLAFGAILAVVIMLIVQKMRNRRGGDSSVSFKTLSNSGYSDE